MRTILYIPLLAILFASCRPLPVMRFGASETVDMPGVSKDKLYQRAVEWFNETFKNTKAVIQSQDKEAGTFYAKGAFEFFLSGRTDVITFSINIAVKDGKYRYVISDFNHAGASIGHRKPTHKKVTEGGGNLESIKPIKSYPKLSGRYWQKVREYAQEQQSSIISVLKNKMRSKSLPETF